MLLPPSGYSIRGAENYNEVLCMLQGLGARMVGMIILWRQCYSWGGAMYNNRCGEVKGPYMDIYISLYTCAFIHACSTSRGSIIVLCLFVVGSSIDTLQN